jgi:hypothetical protein
MAVSAEAMTRPALPGNPPGAGRLPGGGVRRSPGGARRPAAARQLRGWPGHWTRACMPSDSTGLTGRPAARGGAARIESLKK